MTATLVFGVLIVVIVLALQRNDARQRNRPRDPAGSATVRDRDAERVAADLAAAATRRR
jgi:hypothetical protein